MAALALMNSIMAPLAVAAGTGYLEKILFATIYEPESGETLTFSTEEEAAAIAELIENGEPITFVFDIKGVAEPDKSVQVYISTVVPEDISDFEAEVDEGAEVIRFSWTPRPLFHYEEQDMFGVDPDMKSMSPEDIHRLDDKIDYTAVVERNQVWQFLYDDYDIAKAIGTPSRPNPEKTGPFLDVDGSELDDDPNLVVEFNPPPPGNDRVSYYTIPSTCTYTDLVWSTDVRTNEANVVVDCGATAPADPNATYELCCDETEHVVTDECKYDFDYDYTWQGYYEGSEEPVEIREPYPPKFNMPFYKGIYEYIYWMYVNFVISQTTISDEPVGEAMLSPELYSLRIASLMTVQDWDPKGITGRRIAYGSSGSSSSSSSSSSTSSGGDGDDDGDGGGPCFPGETSISSFDGSFMNIDEVNIGDDVLTQNIETGEKEQGFVTDLYRRTVALLYTINDDEIRTTDDHPFYTRKMDGQITWAVINPEKTVEEMPYFLGIGTLEIGDSIFHMEKGWVEVESMTPDYGRFPVYNLVGITKNNNFIANGFLVHNRPAAPPLTPQQRCASTPCIPICEERPEEKYALHNEYFLVDDFERYEIWYNKVEDPDHPYLAHLGVARDEEISHKIDPLAMEMVRMEDSLPDEGGTPPRKVTVEIPFSLILDDEGNPFDESATYYFTIFELQRVDTLDPTQTVVPVDTSSSTNDEGYLFTGTNPNGGLEIKITGATVDYPPYTNARIEVEMRHMLTESDGNGEFEILGIPFLTLNPVSALHQIIAIFTADDTVFEGTSEDDAFIMASQQEASYFMTEAISLTPPLLNIETEPYGTVYDSYTKMPVENVVISCSGKSIATNGMVNDYELVQKTFTDGYFSFFAAPGQYKLDVLSIHDGMSGNYVFPAEFPEGPGCDAAMASGDSVYTMIYCKNPPEYFQIADEILHFDVPVDPTIYGQAEPGVKLYLISSDTGEVVDSTFSIPDTASDETLRGRFSFFADTSRTYIVSTSETGVPSVSHSVHP